MESSGNSAHSLRLALRFPLRSFFTAFRFLTILPVSWKNNEDEKFFQACVIWFPVVGLFVGAITAFFVSLVAPFLPVSLSAFFAVLLLGGISGFLHLDGLADSGDGLLSSRPREKALTIMRDSRTGAMGVILLLFLLLGKYAALSSLSVDNLLPAIFLMPIAGRTAILLSMAILPYARAEDGLGHLFYSRERYLVAVCGILFFIVCTGSISLQTMFFFLSPLLFTVGLFSLWCFVKLGGATGDTLGAVCEISELSIAVGAVVCQGTV